MNFRNTVREHFGTTLFTGEFPFTGGYLVLAEEHISIFTTAEGAFMNPLAMVIAFLHIGGAAVRGTAPAWDLIPTPMITEETAPTVIGLVRGAAALRPRTLLLEEDAEKVQEFRI